MESSGKIIYTRTDEAPALATYSFLPIVEAFTSTAGIEIEERDISLAARILAVFPDYLSKEQQVHDDLSYLGNLAKMPEANIIKLPNISASVPQLKAAIKELQDKGYAIPGYPDEVSNDKEKEVRARYDKIKGSAVNPVLREGNSDRRAPKAVKNYAKKKPHSMGAWSPESKSHVATMSDGDFRSNEKSIVLSAEDSLSVTLIKNDGGSDVLKEGIDVLQGEIIDATILSKSRLLAFLEQQVNEAKAQGILFSLHMKATMMKVSDPIIFGHAVKTYFKDVFDTYGTQLDAAGADANNGLGSVLNVINGMDNGQEILEAINACIANGPSLAMVNSDKGITNLHVPSDVIIDASMPAMIRNSGQMWNSEGASQDTKAVIPDSSYAGIYQASIDFCKEHGALDPTTMGTVPNVGLMAQKAEEYGSHDKTFEIQAAGTVEVSNSNGDVLISHEVEPGDIWRMCQVKDAPIQNWVQLAVARARATSTPAVFWLDESRAHDQKLIEKVNTYLPQHDTSGLEIHILSPLEATKFTLARIKEGQDTISVSGNVLRDYLTDLFPILELGTSAKMLSIVPLMNGGGLFETGAGGSAPKHVQQFVEEGHLRWDSLGEFLALAVSLEHLAETTGNKTASVLAETLDQATGMYLDNDNSPSRKVGELGNRGSHFYLAMYWAQALSTQSEDPSLNEHFSVVYNQLKENEATIVAEILSGEGSAVDIKGYFLPDSGLAATAMRPSATFTSILKGVATAGNLA